LYFPGKVAHPPWSETVDRAEANRQESKLRMSYKKANDVKRPVWDRNK